MESIADTLIQVHQLFITNDCTKKLDHFTFNIELSSFFNAGMIIRNVKLRLGGRHLAPVEGVQSSLCQGDR